MEGWSALTTAPRIEPEGAGLGDVWDQFYAYCLAIIHQTPGVRRLSPDDRDDCAHEVMVEIIRRFREQRPEDLTDQIDGWIRILSRNKAADIVRRRIRKPEVAFDDGSGRDIAHRADPEANAVTSGGEPAEPGEYVAQVWEALVGLDTKVPVTSYLVFYLRTIENWSIPEIADLFQITPEQARARCCRVRKKFNSLVRRNRTRREGA